MERSMKNIIKYIIIIAMMIPISCAEDFLDRYPLDQISSGTFDPNLALVGVYDPLQNFDGTQNFHNIDCMTPMGYTRSGRYNIIAQGAHDPFTESVLAMWQETYEGVFRANDFLEKIEDHEMDDEEKQLYIGEAKFLRAFYYSKLADFYGNVPLMLKTLTIDESRTYTNSSKSEVVAQILTDLDDAINLLPEVPQEVGRATKGAALALKARVNLYEGNWQEAADAAQDVMELDIYDLYYTGDSADYSMVFHWSNENNVEVIFDVQFAGPDLGEGNWFESSLMNKNSVRNGFVQCNPVQFILDAYETRDGSSIDYSDPENYSQYKNRDYRLDATIIRHGATFNGRIWNEDFPGYFKSQTGYVLRKYVMDTEDQTIVKRFDGPNNFILIRYADVLLMYAEAKNELSGPDQSVYSAINYIRERAGLQPLNPGLGQSEMREKIRHERMVELAFEGLYYSDIRRWGIAEDNIQNNQPYTSDGDLVVERTFDPAKHYLLPIPQTEIDNVPTLEQNPGW